MTLDLKSETNERDRVNQTELTPFSIVLDSTVFGDIPRADGPLFAQLKDYVSRSGAKLFISTVVIKEVERSLGAVVRENVKGVKRLSVAGALPDESGGLSDVDDLTERARASFRDQLAQLNPQEIEIPDVPHDEVIDRLHAGKKPFGGTDNRREDGYRDYLIWRTVLEIAAHDPSQSVVLISGDKRAFAGKGGQLASEMLEDAERLGVSVRWRPDLWSFLKEETTPWQQSVRQLRDVIDEDASTGRLSEFLTENIPDTPVRYVLAEPETIGLHPYLDDLSIVGLTDVQDIDVVEVLSLTGEMGVGRIRAHVTLHLSQIVDADDPPISDEDDWPVTVTRLDRRHALAELDVEAVATFDIGYDFVAARATPWGLEVAEVEF